MTPLRRCQLLAAALLVASLSLGSWVFVLKRQLYVANYYVDSGIESVRHICMPALSTLSVRGTLSMDLDTHVRACLGVTLPVKEQDAISKELEHRDVAALIRRLETMLQERRLPHVSVDPVGTLAPKQYVDGEPLPKSLQ